MIKPKEPPTADAVGRGKPPEHTRFKPGQSGNPKGRPKRSRSLSADVQEALRMPVIVTEGGKRKQVTMQAGSLLKLLEKALKGDARAINLILTLAARYNDQPLPAPGDEPLTDDDAVILADYRARHASLDRPGISEGPKAVADNPDAESASAGKGAIRRRISRRR